jgi:hypothetical protein
MNKKWIIAAIGYALILLYCYALIQVLLDILNFIPSKEIPSYEISSGNNYILTIIGAFISSVVIAYLAITPEGKYIRFHPLRREEDKIEKILTSVYLIIWILTGGASIYFGILKYPDICDTLSDIGRSWIGVGIAAVAAYLGIDVDGLAEKIKKVKEGSV